MKALVASALLLSLAACAAAPVEDTAEGTGAQVASTLSSLNGVNVVFQPRTEEALRDYQTIPAGLLRTSQGVTETTTAGVLPKKGSYGITIENISDRTEEIDGFRSTVTLPATVIQGAVGRLVILALQPNGALDHVVVAANAQKTSAFETLSIDGETANFDTHTMANEHLTGSIPLPGLADGTLKYAITVQPRNVPAGSILGTHLFAVRVACKVAGCVATDPAAPSAADDANNPPRR